jgi:tetratricopeptide (TPR) repeat protein
LKQLNLDPGFKALARSASCLEIAGDAHASARCYEEAAQGISQSNLSAQLAAELYNRAALQYIVAQEYFFAGSCWTRTAEEFAKLNLNVVTCSENLSPLPMSSLKSHLCGRCFEAAAGAYAKALGNEMWSAGAYWRAGRSYAAGIPNIQAFEAYRRALFAEIEHYNTLELDELRLSLPLSQFERDNKMNPIDTMEQALIRINNTQQSAGGKLRSRLNTHRQMAATFHKFSMKLQAIGNPLEAGRFRAAQNDRQRLIAALNGNYWSAGFYWLWKITSSYGESLVRWAATCLCVIVTFALAYHLMGIIEPSASESTTHLTFFDAFYFSVVTFTTLGYGDIHPVGVLGQSITCLEVVTGFTMFGILLSFVGNRFQR